MYKLLFVDDEAIYRITIRGILDWKESGFVIAGTVGNGAEAIEFLRHTQVDGIITDLEMPVMDGVTLIKKLRAEGFSDPILALSNYSDYERVRGALTAGAFDYLIKLEMTPANLIIALNKMAQQCQKLQNDIQSRDASSPKEQLLPLLRRYILDVSDSQPPQSLNQLIPQSYFPVTVSTVKVFKELSNGSAMSSFLETSVRECFKAVEPIILLPLHSSELLFLLPNEPLRRSGINLSAHMRSLSRQMDTFPAAKSLLTYRSGVTDIGGIREAYHRCASRYTCLFYSDCESVAELPRDYNGNHNAVAFLPIRNGFISAAIVGLKSANSEEFFEVVRCYMQTCRQQCVPPTFLKDSVTSLVWCSRDLGLLPVTDDSFRNIICEIETASNSKQLMQSMHAFFTHIAGKQNPSAPVRQEIEQAMLFVNQNYDNKLTLDAIASHVGLTREYLSRLFLKETGVNLFQYITDVRMRKAAELLGGSEPILIKEVALMVGFENQYSFSKKFKEYYGVSPVNYKASRLEPKQ